MNSCLFNLKTVVTCLSIHFGYLVKIAKLCDINNNILINPTYDEEHIKTYIHKNKPMGSIKRVSKSFNCNVKSIELSVKCNADRSKGVVPTLDKLVRNTNRRVGVNDKHIDTLASLI